MPTRINTQPPTWLIDPELVQRRFHDRELHVWQGDLNVSHIAGWIGNPRTELLRDQFVQDFARDPSNEEMCAIVLADDDEKEGLKIKELAANIRKNGVRVPIVLSHDKKLLDGNRRYYASMFLLTNAVDAGERERFARVPAYVLQHGTTPEIEQAIITEFNFAPNMQLDWPYFVRARTVFVDYDEHGLDKDQLQAKYGIPWRYLGKWVKAAELCDRFLKFHQETFNSKQFAYRNFIMFDEMMRNYGIRFKEATFREAVFSVLLNGYEPENHKGHKFTKSDDLVRLDEIHDNPDAWQALVSGRGPKALQEALGILEISNLGGQSDPNPALRRVINGLERLVNNRALASANPELLQAFQSRAQQVPGGPTDPASQIDQMIEWLEGMTARQLSELNSGSLIRLERALFIVRDMVASGSTHRASGATSEAS